MDKKGQAALEYLMTYGWALIVIAIVVGVLVFIVTTPTDIMTCSSGQPSKINVVSHNLSDEVTVGDGLGQIVITNVAGGTISSVDLVGDGSLFAATGHGLGDGTTVTTPLDGDGTDTLSVGNTTITLLSGPTGGDFSAGSVAISYNDPSGLAQSTSITCQGASITVG